MPAGPEELPDYPEFRRRLIADCQRLDAPVPEERLIQAEHEHRRRELAALAEAEAAWNAPQREWEGASRP